jgi:hypothetical protein
MKQSISFGQFCDSFGDRENFSYKGKRALFDYLEQYEEETGEEIELDAVALCCEFTEYESLKELQENYDNIETMEDLRDNTQVIEIEGTEGFIIQDF